LGHFRNRDFQELVGGAGTSHGAEPGPSIISGDRVGITHVTVGSEESSGASLVGNQASHTNVSSDFGRITVMDQKFESIGVRRNQGKLVKIPSYFDTIVVQIRGNTDCGRVNESKGRRISSETQVPIWGLTRWVLIVRREIPSNWEDGEDIGSISVFSGNGLNGGLPDTTDFDRKVRNSVELPISRSVSSVSRHIRNKQNWRHGSTTGLGRISQSTGESNFVTTVYGIIYVNGGPWRCSIEVGGTKLDLVSVDASRVLGTIGKWEVLNGIRNINVVGDSLNSKSQGILVSVKQSKVVIVDTIGVKDLIFIESR